MAGSVADHQRFRRLNTEPIQRYPEDLRVVFWTPCSYESTKLSTRSASVGEGGSQVEVNVADDPNPHASSLERLQSLRDVVGRWVMRRVRLDRIQGVTKIVIGRVLVGLAEAPQVGHNDIRRRRHQRDDLALVGPVAWPPVQQQHGGTATNPLVCETEPVDGDDGLEHPGAYLRNGGRPPGPRRAAAR